MARPTIKDLERQVEYWHAQAILERARAEKYREYLAGDRPGEKTVPRGPLCCKRFDLRGAPACSSMVVSVLNGRREVACSTYEVPLSVQYEQDRGGMPEGDGEVVKCKRCLEEGLER